MTINHRIYNSQAHIIKSLDITPTTLKYLINNLIELALSS